MSHRRVLKELVDIGRRTVEAGFVIGEDGNISARSGSSVYIKRRGASMGAAKSYDYIPLDIKTGKPRRRHDKPSSEIHMHLACYMARKDITAVVHTHPIFATAMAISGAVIMPVTYELGVNVGSPIARVSSMKAGTAELGKAVGRAVKKHNAILLKDHGLVTVGGDLEEAFLRTLAIERAALTYISCKILTGRMQA